MCCAFYAPQGKAPQARDSLRSIVHIIGRQRFPSIARKPGCTPETLRRWHREEATSEADGACPNKTVAGADCWDARSAFNGVLASTVNQGGSLWSL